MEGDRSAVWVVTATTGVHGVHIVIDVLLPWPPSVNAIWRRGRGRTYRNPKYVAWIKEAGWAIKAARGRKIKGAFRAESHIVPPNLRSDLDNFVKPVLDLAQKMELIENDKFCQKAT